MVHKNLLYLEPSGAPSVVRMFLPKLTAGSILVLAYMQPELGLLGLPLGLEALRYHLPSGILMATLEGGGTEAQEGQS